jgi:uncharacterized protein (DUF4415 family)
MNDKPDDNPEWSSADFKKARPASQLIGEKAAAMLMRKGGRPPKPADERKRQVTMRFAPDLLEAMRSTGAGWQARAEQTLRREFVSSSAVRDSSVRFAGAKSAAAPGKKRPLKK